jgi:hypothetical protein
MPQVRRPAAAALTRVGSSFRTRRLSLAGLSPASAAFARLALAAVVVAGAAIVLKASGIQVAIPSYDLQPTTILFTGGLGVASAVIAAGASQARRRGLGIGLVALVSLAGATLGTLLVNTAQSQLSLSTLAGNPTDQADLVRSAGIAAAAGWDGAIVAVGAVVAAAWRRPPTVVGVLTAGPYVLAIAAYVVADPVYHPGATLGTTIDPVSGRILVSNAIDSFLPVLQQGPLVALLMWQALEYGRWSIEIGDRVRRVRLDPVRLLAAALVVKLGWLALGYAGRLPGARVWEASRGDGPFAWILALGFAALAGSWLATRRRATASAHGTDVAAGIVVVAFIFSSIATTILLEATFVTTLVVPSALGPGSPLLDLIHWLTNQFGLLSLLSIPFAALLALALRAARRAPQIALFLSIFAIWAGVRGLPLIPQLLDPGAPAGPNPTSIELVTLDAAMTVVIAVLFVLWLARRQRASPPGDLLVVLVASTFVAYAGAVAGDTVGVALGGVSVYLAALFPFAFRYLWNAGSLNAPSPDRAARLLIVIGLGALTLVVAASHLLADVAASGPGVDELAQAVLLVPAVATLIVATLGSSHRAAEPSLATTSATAEPA